VKKIDPRHEEGADAEAEEKTVILEPAGVPDDHEDAAGDDDREKFHDGVEEQVVGTAEEIEAHQGQPGYR
jgi:hypothetical protein